MGSEMCIRDSVADALFHSGAPENLSGLADAELDALLERARVEPDAAARLELYREAEGRIGAAVPAIFLSHPRSYMLVSPRITGFVQTPVRVPIERYLSLEQ